METKFETVNVNTDVRGSVCMRGCGAQRGITRLTRRKKIKFGNRKETAETERAEKVE